MRWLCPVLNPGIWLHSLDSWPTMDCPLCKCQPGVSNVMSLNHHNQIKQIK